MSLKELAAVMRANSERWFPETHAEGAPLPLRAFYAMGLCGEAGEVLEVVKKAYRDGIRTGQPWTAERVESIGAELADVFTYLLLLADELSIDLVAEYERKRDFNERRFSR